MASRVAINQDFREFAQSLNDSGVRYLVVGGYAVAFHGYPRYTKDLDLWIWMDPANAAAVVRALEAFGFGSLGLQPQDFLDPDQVVQLGYPPNRIDLISALEGVEFEDCYRTRVDVTIDGTVLPFIGREQLKANKRATGRLQDQADVEHLGGPATDGGAQVRS